VSHRIDLFCEDLPQKGGSQTGSPDRQRERRMVTAADILAKFPATRMPLGRFHSGSSFEAARGVQSPDTDQPLLRNQSAVATPREISFGSFRLLPTQRLLLQGDRPVPLGSRALEILIVLLERPSELVSKQELMARVWPNTFVEPANLTVHISALRRALRDGRGGNRFIINIPGRGYCFVAPVTLGGGTGNSSW
jgi:DNA-binding winged helix-turn-helix (wHTH) protein